MSDTRDIFKAEIFEVKNHNDFDYLKTYGHLDKSEINWSCANIEKGEWRGPGKYALLSYTEKRGNCKCCGYDIVYEVIDAHTYSYELSKALKKIQDTVSNIGLKLEYGIYNQE